MTLNTGKVQKRKLNNDCEGEQFWVRDTSPKTTLPKRHFAETTLCRMRHFTEILLKFGKNDEKDVFKSISYNVIFFITFT